MADQSGSALVVVGDSFVFVSADFQSVVADFVLVADDSDSAEYSTVVVESLWL